MTFLKNHKKAFLLWIIALSLLLLFIFNKTWLYALFVITFLFLLANWYVYRLVAYNATHLFSTVGRNYRRVIIGELFDKRQLGGDEKDTIFFLSPTKRSSRMSFELVRRLYSLLDEKYGELVIVLRNHENEKVKTSVFDIPYLHQITLRSLGLELMKWKSRFPVFFEPLASMRVLFNYMPSSILVEAQCPFTDLTDFCLERNIKLRFFYIQS